MKVLITGSNSGFGLLAALGFARAGHDVVATMRDPAKGDALRAVAAGEGLSIEIRQLDVTDDASVAAAIPDPGELDVLVNNAGFEVQAAMELVDDQLLDRQLDTNVRGPMRVTRAVLPAWRARGSGVIVNVSSVAGVVAVPYGGAYAASKHALEAITEAMHYELSPLGLRFALIEPGRFETEFHSNIVTPPWMGAVAVLRAGDAVPRRAHVARRHRAGRPPARGGRDHHRRDRRLRPTAHAGRRRRATDRLRARPGDFEQFEATMRAALNWYD